MRTTRTTSSRVLMRTSSSRVLMRTSSSRVLMRTLETAHGGAEPLGPLEDLGQVHLPTQLTACTWVLLQRKEIGMHDDNSPAVPPGSCSPPKVLLSPPESCSPPRVLLSPPGPAEPGVPSVTLCGAPGPVGVCRVSPEAVHGEGGTLHLQTHSPVMHGEQVSVGLIVVLVLGQEDRCRSVLTGNGSAPSWITKPSIRWRSWLERRPPIHSGRRSRGQEVSQQEQVHSTDCNRTGEPRGSHWWRTAGWGTLAPDRCPWSLGAEPFPVSTGPAPVLLSQDQDHDAAPGGAVLPRGEPCCCPGGAVLLPRGAAALE
ncbi:hypothetical protein EYF80_030784 [Liparis tanakae]|uniref:Uncharacterized protein n=1 Tax=Liparis tanakae TaxID=230148 RepID=A0A4Z2GZV5_9TELE|nr:hypothetical protein EYF80_030784 [Liparis tanakae]